MNISSFRLLCVLLVVMLTTPSRGAGAVVSEQEHVVSSRAGVVTRADGEVLYGAQGDRDMRRLQIGVRLINGDAVTTAAKSRAEWSLTPDSYLQVGADSRVRVYETSLDRMHFDVERGEVFIIVRSLAGGAALIVHAPPGEVTVRKPGRYRFRVATSGETEAAVGSGELRYVDDQGKTVVIRKRKRIRFHVTGKKEIHGA
jgi:ferric-dicitrate binding protein FerR (iron transport regulator)